MSYASSPPVEVLFADPPVDEALTGAMIENSKVFRQVEYVGILSGTENQAAAESFIDFLLSKTFQEDMPLNMFVYPVNVNAELPDLFTAYSQVAEDRRFSIMPKLMQIVRIGCRRGPKSCCDNACF